MRFYILTTLVICFLYSCKETDTTSSVSIKNGNTITLSFQGPQTSENDPDNPFLNYLLQVTFAHADQKVKVKGFYAADGNSANTSDNSGNVWQVRFAPDNPGEWTYSAILYHGDSAAVTENPEINEQLPISNDNGIFQVVSSDNNGSGPGFISNIVAERGFLKFEDSNEYFLKVGTNSPENFLAYEGFDNTYRLSAASREGEAKTNQEIHSYTPHIDDWQEGDPIWKQDEGKGIIGAVNYLASKGMNSIYFLTLNIRGDGKDVWMYADPEDFTRFDVSKLAQWEILFSHMQSKGIVLHFVLQETENETLLDEGDLGPHRKLYFQELIARFAHHPGIIWNLGEENGPAPWMGGAEFAQTDRQRKASAAYIKANDPYNHPVVIHTLPNDEIRSPVLDSLLGFEFIDGISLQQDDRTKAAAAVRDLKTRSAARGKQWLVMMDEIGMWHTGVKADTADQDHPTITRYALWGTLLSGAAGVEWYFGANSLQNDLTSEDWRERDQLWEITNHAKVFFEQHLPYWEMVPMHDLVEDLDGYCLAKKGDRYALYLPDCTSPTVDLSDEMGRFQIQWYDPLAGGDLEDGTTQEVTAGEMVSIGNPPSKVGKDWVVLLTKMN